MALAKCGFPQGISALNASQLPRAASRAIKEGLLNHSLWNEIAERSVSIADVLDPTQISTILRGFGNLRLKHQPLLNAFTQRLVEQRNANVEVETLAALHILSAYARLQESQPIIPEFIVPAIQKNLKLLSPRDLSRFLHSLSKLRLFDQPLFEESGKLLAESLPDVSATGIVNIASAFSRGNFFDRNLFLKLGKELQSRGEEFAAPDLLNLLRGVARLFPNLPEEDFNSESRRHIISNIISALSKRMAPISLESRLEVFENLIHLDHYEARFMHEKLLPSLLQRVVGITGELIMPTCIRILSCLSRLPSITEQGATLIEMCITLVKDKFPNDIRLLAPFITHLSLMNSLDSEIFSKAAQKFVRNESRLFQDLSKQQVLTLATIFSKSGGDKHCQEAATVLSRVGDEMKDGKTPEPILVSKNSPKSSDGKQHLPGIVVHAYTEGKGLHSTRVRLDKHLVKDS